jgi:glycerol uptake facilitator-like aquaporin
MNEQTKNAEFIKLLGITLIPLHLFFYYYQLMRKTLNISFLDLIYLSLSSKLSMVNSSFLMNFLAMFILLLYAITTPLGKDKELNKSEIVKKLA